MTVVPGSLYQYLYSLALVTPPPGATHFHLYAETGSYTATSGFGTYTVTDGIYAYSSGGFRPISELTP